MVLEYASGLRKSLKMKFSRVAIALPLVVAMMLPATSQAYPPGQNIAVSLTSAGMVKPGTVLTANVTKAKPGAVTITWGTTNATVQSITGTAASTFKPTKTGVYKVTVLDTATTGNTTSAFLYVPSVTFPKKPTSIKSTATFTVRNAKPGTVVTIKIGSKSFKGTVKGTAGKTNKLDIKLKLPKKGSNTVSVSVGTDKKLVFSGKAVGK